MVSPQKIRSILFLWLMDCVIFSHVLKVHVQCFTAMPWNKRTSGGTCLVVRQAKRGGIESDFGSDQCLSELIIQSLDMIPTVRSVASHAGTLRARRALLGLVGEDVALDLPIEHSLTTTSSIRRRVTDPKHHRRKSSRSESVVGALSPIAHSAVEVRQEYELVEQATLALNAVLHNLTYPPLYGADSSPWDIETSQDSDNDEWLDFSLDEWTLEHVLQADQVVATLLNVHEWARQSATQLWVPSLSEIAGGIGAERLKPVHDAISGAVEIVRWRTYADPTGTNSFTFRLNETRFPTLSSLRNMESSLSEKIEKELRKYQRKLEGTTEVIDYEGRLLLSIPKSSNPSKLGLIRWTARTGGRCYVEPFSIVKINDELSRVRGALTSAELDIQNVIVHNIVEVSTEIERGLQIMARLDVLFSKAAFGCRFHGAFPDVKEEGCIDVPAFVHPALALRGAGSTVVPIDLKVSGDIRPNGLIISGANGGGKTVALKSFGLAVSLSRLGVPLPLSSKNGTAPRVDYFGTILVEVGDKQNVMEGESTLLARLNACASVISHVASIATKDSTEHSLVLLDELGGGTDPTAGGALGQAILEKLLESDMCRVVATTHSPRLKALSYANDNFQCATVLLDRHEGDSINGGKYRRPTFQLEYGAIGDSYALGAASRCSPELPEDVLTRAASLMSASEDSDGEYLRALTQSMEHQVIAAQETQSTAETLAIECVAYRDAMRGLARAYERQWASLEERLETLHKTLRNDAAPPMEVVGETLATLRLVREKVKSDDELLRERGLRIVSVDCQLNEGDSVVIVSPNDWEGASATVVQDGSREVTVVPAWDGVFDNRTDTLAMTLTLPRHEVAVWDYSSVFGDFSENDNLPFASVRESRQKLQSLLATIQKDEAKPSLSAAGASSTSSSKSRFTSSRQRKAATNKKKKKKNRSRKGS